MQQSRSVRQVLFFPFGGHLCLMRHELVRATLPRLVVANGEEAIILEPQKIIFPDSEQVINEVRRHFWLASRKSVKSLLSHFALMDDFNFVEHVLTKFEHDAKERELIAAAYKQAQLLQQTNRRSLLV